MSTSEELRAQLRIKEREENLSVIRLAMEKARLNYFNKCYATHTLTRNYKRIDATVEKIIGVSLDIYYYREGYKKLEELEDTELSSAKVVLLQEVISIRLSDDPKANFKTSVSVGSGYTDLNDFRPFRYELSLDEYEIIKNNLIGKIDILATDIRKELPEWNLYITNGEASIDSNMEEYLKEVGLTTVTLPSEEMVFNLRWHPFLYGDKILKTKESVDLIKLRCKNLEETITNWSKIPESYRIINRDREILQWLRNVITLLEK